MSKIVIGLSAKEVSSAIKRVETFKKRLNKKIALLVQKLTDKGIEVAKIEVVKLGAYSSGELEASIGGYFSPLTNVGIIYAGAWFAAYVEFGTGIVGAVNPHPNIQGWKYDINSHGDDGWVYYNADREYFGWSKGSQSKPFMYNTAKYLEDKCNKLAKEIWKL